ncbi:MAG: YHS domain-containing protein [Candidatus Omnitrophica bacterium]|nr:YHS domain-containing protein [Candidatus Omnitrophota bacterium]
MNRIIALTLGVIFLTMGMGFAQQAPSTSQAAVQAVEVGNKHCPVSGKEVGVMGPAFKLEYNGKVYNLCCPGCKSTFNNDPEKYSKIAEADAASENK